MNPTPLLTPKDLPTEGLIEHGRGGSCYSGRGAVDVFRALTLWSALSLYGNHGLIATRGLTLTRMLALAREYTGEAYKRTRAGALAASADVKAWADAARAGLPECHTD